MADRLTENDEPLLVAENLARNYGRLVACRDISFALYPGEVLAVVGMANETNRLANGYRVPVDERFENLF